MLCKARSEESGGIGFCRCGHLQLTNRASHPALYRSAITMMQTASSRCTASSRPVGAMAVPVRMGHALLRTPSASPSGLRMGLRQSRVVAMRSIEEDTEAKPRVPDTPPTPSSSSSTPVRQQSSGGGTATVSRDEAFSWKEFFASELPGKLGVLVGLIVLSRVGVYIRIPGVDVESFAAAMSNNGLMGYVDGEGSCAATWDLKSPMREPCIHAGHTRHACHAGREWAGSDEREGVHMHAPSTRG